MKTLKFLALTISVLFIVTGCGYKIAGVGSSNPPVRFYIEKVINDTIDTEYGTIVQNMAQKYFIRFGEMASYNNATYFLTIRLAEIDFNADITTATDEAVSNTAILKLQIIVTDVNGKEIFSGEYTPSKAFAMSSIVSRSLQNRRSAIEENTETALENFRNAFNSKVYD